MAANSDPGELNLRIVTDADDGGTSSILLPLRVQPKAAKNRVGGTRAGALKVAVTAAPEKGKANAAVMKLLAKRLGVSKSQVRIVAGETSQDKTVAITDVPEVAIRALAEG